MYRSVLKYRDDREIFRMAITAMVCRRQEVRIGDGGKIWVGIEEKWDFLA